MHRGCAHVVAWSFVPLRREESRPIFDLFVGGRFVTRRVNAMSSRAIIVYFNAFEICTRAIDGISIRFGCITRWPTCVLRALRTRYIYMCIIFAKIRGGFCANSRSIQGIKVVSVSVPLYVIRMSGRLIVFRALQDRYFLFLNKFEEELDLDPNESKSWIFVYNVSR